MSDCEMNESPPPVVVVSDEEEIMSAPQNTMNIQNPKMKGPEILDAVPLRMIPYGGKEPIAFDREKLGLFGNQSIPVKARLIHGRKQEVPVPPALQSLNGYKEGDWRAFLDKGVNGRRRDWTFRHRKYRRAFRSQELVKEFLESNGPATGMFQGKEIRKKVVTTLHELIA
nr:unnamed protein product [Digitaria exilis]